MYNSTEGLFKDLKRVDKERKDIMTKVVYNTSQMLGAIADTIHKINPEMVWVDTRHSESGVIGRRAIERLTADQKRILKKQFYNISLGPAQMIPSEYGLKVYNLYSDKDHVTKSWANKREPGVEYNVKLLKCNSSWHERTLFFVDHRFMGPTYQEGLDVEFRTVRDTKGFYNGNTR